MALNKDIKVALLTFLSIVIFSLAYMFMKGTLLHSGNPQYAAIFQGVDKLKKSDRVYLSGVMIGMVDDIEFVDIQRPRDVKVTFSAERGLKIPKDSKIQIISTSLMGTMGLDLQLGNSNTFIKESEIITGIGEEGLLQSLSGEISPLAKTSNSLLENVNTLFDRKGDENLYLTVNNINHTLSTLNKTIASMNRMIETNQKPIHQTMRNFEQITRSLADKQNDINATISNIRDLTGKANQTDIQAMMKNLNSSVSELNGIMTDMNNGKGSLGKLMNDEKLYNDLNKTVNNANELLVDFKAHPKRYVGFSIFGGKK